MTSDEAAVHRLLAQGYDATQATVDYRESNVFERLAGFVMRSENEKPALDFTIVSSYVESMKRRSLSQLASRQSSGSAKNRGFYSDTLSEKSYLSLQGRRMAIMNDLSDHRCKFNSSSPNSYSLLQNSSMGGCSEVIKFLLAHGAKIDANDPGAAIAMNWACQSGDLETVKTLLDNGAKVGSSSSQGYTALMQTTIMRVQYPKDEKYLAILKTLIKQGADVDQKDSYGATALKVAKRSPQLVLTPIVQEMINSLKAASHTLP